MRGGWPACREGALRLLLAVGPAGAERACAAAATPRLERAPAQCAWPAGQWDAAVRLRMRREPVGAGERLGGVCGVEMAGIGVAFTAERAEWDGCASRSETFCGRGERSSKGALRESRVWGASSPPPSSSVPVLLLWSCGIASAPPGRKEVCGGGCVCWQRGGVLRKWCCIFYLDRCRGVWNACFSDEIMTCVLTAVQLWKSLAPAAC